MPAYRTHSRTVPLEVTTDAPLPPTLTIISPTPRTFTFPGHHASPFCSPSASPFQPELKPLSIPSHPHLLRSLTPDSALSTSSPTFSSPSSSQFLTSPSVSRSRSPSAPSSKRRKSTSNVHEPAEHRPKKGDDDYIKRPENAFILFRRKCVEDRMQAQEAAAATADVPPGTKPKKQRQADLSKMISQQWKELSAEEKAHWEGLAKEKKKEHEQLYPNYVYRPQRAKAKAKAAASAVSASAKGKARQEGEHDAGDSVSFVLPLPPSPTTRHGRSNSAPSSQTIRLPVVNMPSGPSTPILLSAAPPPISRRLSYDVAIGRSHRSSPSFDCMQSEPLPPPYPNQAEFEANFRTPEFYQGMWTSAANQPFADKAASMGLAPLVLPPHGPLFHHHPPSAFPPPDSLSPTSSLYAHTPTPTMPQVPAHFSARPGFDADLDSSGISASSSSAATPSAPCLPEYTEMLPELLSVPWTFEFDGELCPGGADFLVDDDFNLSAIPPIQLDMPKLPGEFPDAGAVGGAAGAAAATCDPGLLTARPERGAASAVGENAAEQDPFAGYFFDEMMSAGRF